MKAPEIKAPTWEGLYRLGSEVNRDMEHFCTLDELAQELGVTKQNAHTECVMVLGKLVWQRRVRLGVVTPRKPVQRQLSRSA